MNGNVISLNQSSIEAAKRLGFKFEGIFRQHNVFKDHNRDTAWFSIIDGEWPAIRSKLQKWLDSAILTKMVTKYCALRK